MQTDTSTPRPHDLIASDRVEGTPVRRSNGERIGTIERLMSLPPITSISPTRSSAARPGSRPIRNSTGATAAARSTFTTTTACPHIGAPIEPAARQGAKNPAESGVFVDGLCRDQAGLTRQHRSCVWGLVSTGSGSVPPSEMLEMLVLRLGCSCSPSPVDQQDAPGMHCRLSPSADKPPHTSWTALCQQRTHAPQQDP